MPTLKKSMVALSVVALGTLITAQAFAGSYDSFDEALAAANAQQKPLLVDFYATWCGPCKAFTKATAEDADIQKALDTVVLFKTDAEADTDLSGKFNIKGFPTFVLLNGEGETIDRWSGYEKDYWMGLFDVAMADPTTIDQKLARFEATPSANDAATLARFHDTQGHAETAVGFYGQAAELDADKDYAAEIFDATFTGTRGDDAPFTFADVRAAADVAMASSATDDEHLVMVASAMQQVASKEGDMSIAVPYLKQGVERTAASTDETVQKYRKHLLPTYALLVEKDETKAVMLKRGSMKDGWTDDSAAMNSFAWWCFENKVNLANARQMALKGAELAEDDKSKAMILDTAAELCNLQDDCHEAVALIARAIEADPANDYYKEQQARFQERLTTMD